MPTLLHIDSSPLGEASISRHLSAEFVRNWKRAHPNGEVGFLGAADIHFVAAGGAAQIMQGNIDRETFLKTHVEAIQAEFQRA